MNDVDGIDFRRSGLVACRIEKDIHRARALMQEELLNDYFVWRSCLLIDIKLQGERTTAYSN